MRLQSIKARGFKGLRGKPGKGLGLEEIDVDLSGLKGLIGLAGRNGVGKSSFLELLHPYRILPSRKGPFARHVFLRDSYKDLTFRSNGDEIRTLVKLDSQTRKEEGFIWLNGKPEVKGKVTDYDAYITELFGSASLFFWSAFCAQNAKKFNQLTPAPLKALFSEFLRLHELVTHEETSKTCVTIMDGKLIAAREDVTRLSGSIDGLKATLEEMVDAEKKLDDAREKLTFYRSETDSQTRAIATLREQAAKIEGQKERLVDLEKQLLTTETELQAASREWYKNLAAFETKITELRTKRERLQRTASRKNEVETAKVKLAEVKAEIKKHEDSLRRLVSESDGHRDCISYVQNENAGKDKADDALLQGLREDMTGINAKVSESNATIKKLNAEYKATENDAELARCEAVIAAKKAQCSALDKRDPECTSTTCSFIVSALEAQTELPKLEAQAGAIIQSLEDKAMEISIQLEDEEGGLSGFHEILKAKAKAYNEATVQVEAAQKERQKKLEGLNQYAAILGRDKTKLDAELYALREDESDLSLTLNDAPEIAAAAAEMKAVATQGEELKKQKADAETQWRERCDAWSVKSNDLGTQIDTLRAQIPQRLQERIGEGETILRGVKIETEKTESAVNELAGTIAALKKEAEKLPDTEQELLEAQMKVTDAERELSQWTYTKLGCGANGLRAVKIANTAPQIVGISNDLILEAGDIYSTVKLRTLDDNGKECLDIWVIGEDGEENRLDDESGGEQVPSLKALRLAMMLLSKEKSRVRLDTAFADEEDGALGIPEAQAFVRLYRSAMARGDFEACYFVSHKAPCISMADRVLDFIPNHGIEVQ